MRSGRRFPKLAGLLGVLTAGALQAQAPVYDNGAPNGFGGGEMTHVIRAQDFTLGSLTSLTAIRFWGFSYPSTSPGYAGQVFWQIFSDVTDSPGTVLYSGLVTPTQTFRAAILFGSSYQFDFPIAATLAPGSYWLGLHNGDFTATSFDGFFWEFTDPNSTKTGKFAIPPSPAPPPGQWGPSGDELAFQVYGGPANVVPEPAALVLVATGLSGLALVGLVRRRN